jgi:hypothetical protein
MVSRECSILRSIHWSTRRLNRLWVAIRRRSSGLQFLNLLQYRLDHERGYLGQGVSVQTDRLTKYGQALSTGVNRVSTGHYQRLRR